MTLRASIIEVAFEIFAAVYCGVQHPFNFEKSTAISFELIAVKYSLESFAVLTDYLDFVFEHVKNKGLGFTRNQDLSVYNLLQTPETQLSLLFLSRD